MLAINPGQRGVQTCWGVGLPHIVRVEDLIERAVHEILGHRPQFLPFACVGIPNNGVPPKIYFHPPNAFYRREDDMALFIFWVDKILVAAYGNKWDWCTSIRYKHKISEAGYKLNGDGEINKDKMYMNGGTEAFAFLCIENYYDQMPEQWQWKLDNPGKRLEPQCKETTRKDRGYHEFPATKWTEAHKGQQNFWWLE